MTRKKTLKDFTPEDLQRELVERFADQHFRRGMTMTQMEMLIWETHGMENASALRALSALLARMPLEAPTAKLCPKCSKRIAVKAKDRERSLRTMAGTVTLKRNYHYCDACELGFYPVDLTLQLPAEGELTAEMEKRVLDFAINDVYGECSSRWQLHYRTSASENLFRRVVARIGAHCEGAEQERLQEQLKPAPEKPAEVLVVENDGSMLPIRGNEPWKEAKVGVIYRHCVDRHAPIAGSARYVAVVNGLGEFAPVLEDALRVEKAEETNTVLWLGDGAPCNWRLAEQLLPDAIQILDWYHAVEHAVACGKVLLGEESPWLPLWKQRAESLLAAGDPNALIEELLACLAVQPKRGTKATTLEALNDLVRYYRNNAHRMRYAFFREHGFPIGSGAAESAHRHVLQVRMKRAGQRWAMRNARKLASLRAAYKTGGATRVYDAIRTARDLARRPKGYWRKGHFRYAREGTRDRERCLAASSE
jgi:Uncharacterised protein family (UPF0236)